MFYANTIKVAGCLMMLLGMHPLLGLFGRRPGRGGLLAGQVRHPHRTAAAVTAGQGQWLDRGPDHRSIILGILLGGQLVGPKLAPMLLSFDLPFFSTGIDSAPEAAICSLVALYLLAAIFNLYIPRTTTPLQPLSGSPLELVRDFASCNSRLWQDKLGQISLATTTLFWGVSGNLRIILFPWAAAALGYTTTQASNLGGVVAIGTAAGAVVASIYMRLDKATSVIPLGIAMGLLVMGLNVATSLWVAIPFLIFLGLVGGYLVVPMNALLQHRGHT